MKDKIGIPWHSGYDCEVVLNSENGVLIIRILISNEVSNPTDARANAETVLESLLDLIALERCSHIGQPVHRATVVGGRHYTQDDILVSCVVNTPDNEVEDLKRALNRPSKLNSVYPRLYRNVLQIPNPVGQFMFLYSILFDLKGPTQKEVDSYIRSVEPNVRLLPSNRKVKNGFPYRYETEYTYLRNQVGHTDSTSIVPVVEARIGELEALFLRLVRNAMIP